MTKEKSSLQAKLHNLEHEADGLKENYEEEAASKENLGRKLANAMADLAMWKQKYEVEGLGKADELEAAKLKLQARLSESLARIDQMTLKLQQVESGRSKLTADIATMSQQLEMAQALNSSVEKKARQYDRLVAEWKTKVDGLSTDLDSAQHETKNVASDLFRVKSAYEESTLQLDEVRRENKALSSEIKDIMDQINEGGRSIHEIDKIRKRLIAEKAELEVALPEAESMLEQEENKVLRCHLELTQVQQEISKKLKEKEGEFSVTKKNFARAFEAVQVAFEVEAKEKTEAHRMKKKLETSVLELGGSLEHANAANTESRRQIDLLLTHIRASQQKLEEESRSRAAASHELVAGERRVNQNQNALEESRTLLEQVDRSRREVEQELMDANECLGEQTCTNQALTASKSKGEQEVSALSNDLDEMSCEVRMAEEKATRAMTDAARLSEELRVEQESATLLERERKLLEVQVKDSAGRLSEVIKHPFKHLRERQGIFQRMSSEIEDPNVSKCPRHFPRHNCLQHPKASSSSGGINGLERRQKSLEQT